MWRNLRIFKILSIHCRNNFFLFESYGVTCSIKFAYTAGDNPWQTVLAVNWRASSRTIGTSQRLCVPVCPTSSKNVLFIWKTGFLHTCVQNAYYFQCHGTSKCKKDGTNPTLLYCFPARCHPNCWQRCWFRYVGNNTKYVYYRIPYYCSLCTEVTEAPCSKSFLSIEIDSTTEEVCELESLALILHSCEAFGSDGFSANCATLFPLY